MTPPPVRWMLATACVVLAAGVAALVLMINRYLEQTLPIDSFAGLPAFRVDGVLVSYEPFELGVEPSVIGVGIALLAGAIFVAAAVWRPRG